MDPRHESLKEGFINHIIMTINIYMQENIDSLVQDESSLNEMMYICKQIYSYLDVKVDTDNILSRHNLLSKDVVTFPCIPDQEANKIFRDDAFDQLLLKIKLLLEENTHDERLRKQLLRVIEEYEL